MIGAGPKRCFVVLEGTDGSGKTSLRKYIFRRLKEAGVDVLAIVPQSWHVRAATSIIVKTKFFSEPLPPDRITWAFVADKNDLSQRLIVPHLACRHVVCDRFVASDIVYHDVVYGIPQHVTLSAYKQSAIRIPDITVFVDTPPGVAFERVRKRGTGGKHAWDQLDIQNELHSKFRALFDGAIRELGRSVRIDNGGTQEDAYAQLEDLVIGPYLMAGTK